MEKRLNLDIARNISELEILMKEFLIKKVIYKTIFRGKGLEFEGYRELAPDDDAGYIDWKASTRANKLLIRQYVEERDLKIMLVIDISDNMLLGSTNKLKCEYVAELSASLAHLILSSNDKIGFVLFNDKAVKIVLPEKGTGQFDMLLWDLSNPLLYGGLSDIKRILEFLLGYLDSSINSVIIISDFIRVKKDITKTLSLFSSKFETMAIMVRDPLDKTMPKLKGEVVVEDPVTKEQVIIDPSLIRKVYEKNALGQEKMVKNILSECEIDLLELTTDKPFPVPLTEFLKERVEKRKYVVPIR